LLLLNNGKPEVMPYGLIPINVSALSDARKRERVWRTSVGARVR
jgi:hypothetical protein